MAYPPLALARRMRRRRWLFVALIVVILAGVVALAVRHRTERRSVADYLAVAETVAGTEAAVADGLGDLVANVSDVARPQLMDRLGQLASDAEASVASLASVDVPAPVTEAHGFLSAAARSWADGLSSMADAVTSIIDDSESTEGTEMLQRSFDLLRVGDAAYRGFLAALGRVDPDLITRDFPGVAYDGVAGSVAYDAQQLTTRLQSVFRLAAVHDISVTAITDPEPVAFRESDGVPVVPFSDGFAVSAVVANEGNEPETAVVVSLRLTPADGGADGVTRSETIEELGPGKATTVVFDGFELRPGGLYELVVSSSVEEDADMENGVWTMVFYRNEDA